MIAWAIADSELLQAPGRFQFMSCQVFSRPIRGAVISLSVTLRVTYSS